MSDKAIPVRVAVRIRPLVPNEIAEGHFINKQHFINNQPQVTIKGSSEAFTYDYVFGPDESQTQVYEIAVREMIGEIFKGYNITILAYGQTGSGKTFSMGTANAANCVVSHNSGIIQRAVKDLFSKIGENTSLSYEIKVSFLEIYMEKVYDLLARKRNEELHIREDPNNGIIIKGLTETSVHTWEATLKCLEHGSLNRRTGANDLNLQSSRSHTIFTLTVNQVDKKNSSTIKSSKFHLVDLAGSERATKTRAVGERFAEGVNNSQGLLFLGIVISALCESNPQHIPYRNSKLTRLLQDSLGGNSHALMIACVSPAKCNLEETLNTLRYADRARQIKNKPVVNQDPMTAEVLALRAQVQQLMAGGGNDSSAEVEQLRQQLKFAEEEKVKLAEAASQQLKFAEEEKVQLAEAASQQLKFAEEEKVQLAEAASQQLKFAEEEKVQLAEAASQQLKFAEELAHALKLENEKVLLADAANQKLKQRLEELQAQTANNLGAMTQAFNETSDSAKAIEQVKQKPNYGKTNRRPRRVPRQKKRLQFSRQILKSITSPTSAESEDEEGDPTYKNKSLKRPPHCICRTGGCLSCVCVIKLKSACVVECGCWGLGCQNRQPSQKNKNPPSLSGPPAKRKRVW